MARLNEAAPPPVESVDALKRRFVRQNRELTKANTTQSLRIRTLELETSRILSENLSLRSQIIALQHQSHQHQSRAHAVLAAKNQLETKLEELGRLVCELGDSSVADQVGAGAVKNRGPARSPDPKNWKNTLSLSDVAQGHGHGPEGSGRLPVILEDKYYPRRTMNADELINLLSGPGTVSGTASADSPDLGPPPVAHFESEEVPIRFDPSSMPTTSDRDVEQEVGNPVLSANLETRKRRKDGGSNAELLATKGNGAAYGVEELTFSVLTTEKEQSGSSQHLNVNLNPPAKRKLSVRDAEEVSSDEGTTATGKDESLYNRRLEARCVDEGTREPEHKHDGNVSNARVTGDLPVPRGASHSSKGNGRTAATTGASVRKALEPKSANTDPLSSPIKNGKHAVASTEKIPDAKKDTSRKGREKDRNRERDRKLAATIDALKPAEAQLKHEPSLAQSNPPPPPNAEAATDLPPETPAPLDLFSPQSSTEPSAARPESRDTPPPSDLNPLSSSTTDAFNTAGRASRRPRAGVSYAEPNLRDKMRRPTKALADAVGAEERVQRAINGARAGSEGLEGKVDSDVVSAESAKMRTVVIKKENVSEPVWKLLPCEPSHQQQKYRAGATSPLDDRSLRTGINGNGNRNGELPPSVLTARRHRGSSVHRAEAGEEPNEPSEKYPSSSASVAGTTIAALVAGTARKRERMMQQQQQQQQQRADDKPQDENRTKDKDKNKVLDEVTVTVTETGTGTAKVDVYDFHAPPEPAALVMDGNVDANGNGTRTGTSTSTSTSTNGGPSRASRRHSAMSSSSSARHTGIASRSNPIVDPSNEEVGRGTRSRPSGARSGGRRRGTLGLDGATETDDLAGGEDVGGDGPDRGLVTKARSVVDLKGKAVAGDEDVDVDRVGTGIGMGRAERVAARRRSMML